MNFPDMAEEALRKGRQALLLVGDGGLGKTTGMLELYRRLLDHPIAENGKSLIPIYIPLASCDVKGRKDDLLCFVLTRLTKMKFDCAEQRANSVENLKTMLQGDTDFHYVFLLDACNECGRFLDFVPEIKELQGFPSVSVLLSSRETPVSFRNWTAYCLQPLDRDRVRSGLKREGFEPITEGMLTLLTNPFYLSRFLKMKEGTNQTGPELNRYSLLEAYMSWSVQKQQESKSAFDLMEERALNQIASPLAFELAVSRNMVFDPEDEELEAGLTRTFEKYGTDLELACEHLLCPLGLVVGQGTELYQWSHEINRDFWAARWLVRQYESFRIKHTNKKLFSLLGRSLPSEVLAFFADYLRGQPGGLREGLKILNDFISRSDEMRGSPELNRNLIALYAEEGPVLDGVEFKNRNLTKASFIPFTKLLDVDFRGSSFTPEAFSFPAEENDNDKKLWVLFPRLRRMAIFRGNRLLILDLNTGKSVYISGETLPAKLFVRVDERRALLIGENRAEFALYRVRFSLIDVAECKELPINMEGIPFWMRFCNEFEYDVCTSNIAYADNKIYITARDYCVEVIDIDRGYLGRIEAFMPILPIYQQATDRANGDFPLFIFANGGSDIAPIRDVMVLGQQNISFCRHNVGEGPYHTIFLPEEIFRRSSVICRYTRQYFETGSVASHEERKLFRWYQILSLEIGNKNLSGYSNELGISRNKILVGWYEINTNQHTVLFVDHEDELYLHTVDLDGKQITPPEKLGYNLNVLEVTQKNEWLLLKTPAQDYFLNINTHSLMNLSEKVKRDCNHPDSRVLDFALSSDGAKLYCLLSDGAACIEIQGGNILWVKECNTSYICSKLNHELCRVNYSCSEGNVLMYSSRTDGNIFEFQRETDGKTFYLRDVYDVAEGNQYKDIVIRECLQAINNNSLMDAKLLYNEQSESIIIKTEYEGCPFYTVQIIKRKKTGIEEKKFQLSKADYLRVGLMGNEIWTVSKNKVTAFSDCGEILWNCFIGDTLLDARHQFLQMEFGEVCGYKGIFILSQFGSDIFLTCYLMDSYTETFKKYAHKYSGNFCCFLDKDFTHIDISISSSSNLASYISVAGPITRYNRYAGWTYHITKKNGEVIISIPNEYIWHKVVCGLWQMPEPPQAFPVREDTFILWRRYMQECCLDKMTSTTWYPFCHEVTGSKFEGCTGFSEKEKTILQQYGAESV